MGAPGIQSPATFAQLLNIEMIIRRFSKDNIPVVAALYDMLRLTGQCKTSESCH
jgi:hypothetical protein